MRLCSFDQGIYGHVTGPSLAVLSAERGAFAEAERLWNEVLAECPGVREALSRLGRAQVTAASTRSQTAHDG